MFLASTTISSTGFRVCLIPHSPRASRLPRNLTANVAGNRTFSWSIAFDAAVFSSLAVLFSSVNNCVYIIEKKHVIKHYLWNIWVWRRVTVRPNDKTGGRRMKRYTVQYVLYRNVHMMQRGETRERMKRIVAERASGGKAPEAPRERLCCCWLSGVYHMENKIPISTEKTKYTNIRVST